MLASRSAARPTAPTRIAAAAPRPAPAAATDDAGLSRYGRLARDWRARIVAAEWQAGAPIPPESELARLHGVALGTVRQALSLLVDEGLLERIQGRGTFVTRGLAGASMLRFFRFGPATRDGGPAIPQSRILARRTVRADAAQARSLGLGTGDPLLRLTRLRELDDRPVLRETLWLPLQRFRALADSPTADWDDLLYPMFSSRCGVTIVRADDELTFTTLGPAPARSLGLAPGSPGVRVQRRAWDLAGACVELRESLGDAHALRYRAELR